MYVIIGMFVLATILATYSCLEPFVFMSYQFLPSCPTLQVAKDDAKLKH